MKKYFLLLSATLLLAGCNVTLNTPDDNNATANIQEDTNADGATNMNEEEIIKIVDARIAEYMESKDFDAALSKGIDRYVADQQAKQQEDAAAAAEEQRKLAEQAAKNVKPLKDNDHYLGNSDAEIVLIEYSDFECPFCSSFHTTAHQVVDKYGDEIAWTHRHFPLGFHQGAMKKAEGAECVAKLAGEDAFWTFADAIYADQSVTVDMLGDIAEEAGADKTAFQECLDSGEMADRVQEDIDEGTAAGISGTPGNILLNTKTGEVKVLGGAVPINMVESAIAELTAAE